MWTAVWPILCKAMQPRLALHVAAIFTVVLGCEAVAAPAEGLAACLKAEGQAAIAACTAAITTGKDQGADLAIAHIIRGNAYFNTGDYNRATRDYDEAIRLSPTNAVAFYNRANVFNSVGQYDAAIENYDKAIELRPDYANAFNNRCSAYTAKDQHDRAIEDCSRAIELDSTKANFFVGRGNAYSKKEDHDRALTDYDQAIRLDANYANAYSGRCSVLIDKADYGGAIESCDQALKRQPNNPTARNNRCWARAILGGPQEQLKQALNDCDEALRLRSNDPYLFDSRGFVYLKLGDFDKSNFDKSIADYDQSIFLGGERASSLYGRGIAKLRKGDAGGGDKDVMLAKKKKPHIAEEFRGYGVQ
jgi:tetratricopeptide (TPR) repeat protein